MPSMFGICPQRARRGSSLLGWLFGNSKSARVAVGFTDEEPARVASAEKNVIVRGRGPYNLRPRRKAISYKETEEEPSSPLEA
jgi:hypothetical protein